MGMKKKILIISFTDTRRDPRVRRQVDALKDAFDVTTAGVCPENNYDIAHIRIEQKRLGKYDKIIRLLKLMFRRYTAVYWSDQAVVDAYRKCNLRYDLILANDMDTVPLCVTLSQEQHVKLFVDLHEYQPRLFDDELLFRVFLKPYWDYMCRKYLPATDAATTVCDSIAKEYRKNYGVEFNVIINAPDYTEIDPSDVDPDNIKIVYHGGVNSSRKLEYMIELMEYLDTRYSLYLMLVNNDQSYFRYLEGLAKGRERIHMVSPVAMDEIVTHINQYDIGLYMLPASNFNNELALPNKIFEYVQARLAVLTWPSVEMAKLVRDTQTGLVSKSRSILEMAEIINGLLPEQIMEFKNNSSRASRIFNSEKSKKKIRSKVSDILE